MFWIALGAFIFGSLMCWSNGRVKLVVYCCTIWVLGFFILPYVSESGAGYLFMALQSVLAIVLVFTWKYIDDG
jgi:hypothetical protein